MPPWEAKTQERRPALRHLGVVLLAVLLAACRTATPSPKLSDSVNPQNEHKEVQWVRTSAEYRASLIQTYHLAHELLAAMVVDREPDSWAVALDADETVIDNSLYQQERADVGKGFSSESWADWVARREAPPLPGAMDFLHRVHALGGKIAIVTNRRQNQCLDTEANFRAYSIPFDVILCKQRGEDRKEPRWRSIEEGTASPELPPLDIVMWLGDNIRDFPELDQNLRFGPETGLDRFGHDFFVIPNPMYGSWETKSKE